MTLIASLTADQQQALAVELADAAAARAHDFDFSHVLNSQYLPVAPFLTSLG